MSLGLISPCHAWDFKVCKSKSVVSVYEGNEADSVALDFLFIPPWETLV